MPRILKGYGAYCFEKTHISKKPLSFNDFFAIFVMPDKHLYTFSNGLNLFYYEWVEGL